MSAFTVKVDIEKYEEIKAFYLDYKVEDGSEYLEFRSRFNDVLISFYTSNKTKRTIIFDGKLAEEELNRWGLEPVVKEKKEVIKTEWIDLDTQVGSDEVGVGDFLLPMIVVAAYVKKSQIRSLKALGIDDSKKMNDAKILEVGPEVIKRFAFSKLTLHNDKYNEMYLKNENINSLKAKMHNRALSNMVGIHKDAKHVFVDQFAAENLYYSYLDERDEPIVKDIIFKTKGESYYPSVALASVIARYFFLLEQQKMSKEYGIDIPYGAGVKADKVAKELLDKLGIEEFTKLVKKNFKNYNKLLEEKDDLI